MFDVQRFIKTIDSKTLMLIDHAYLRAEFERYHSFYSELYSGADPEMPKKVLPSQLNASDLIDALCKYGNARREKSSVFMFRRQSEPDIISQPTRSMLETVTCTEPTWAEMGRVIEASPEAKRVILVADSPQYSTFLNMLKTRDYDVCVIKHKQEEDDDLSHMPPDMPYQFSFYIVGEAMGLSRGEL